MGHQTNNYVKWEISVSLRNSRHDGNSFASACSSNVVDNALHINLHKKAFCTVSHSLEWKGEALMCPYATPKPHSNTLKILERGD